MIIRSYHGKKRVPKQNNVINRNSMFWRLIWNLFHSYAWILKIFSLVLFMVDASYIWWIGQLFYPFLLTLGAGVEVNFFLGSMQILQTVVVSPCKGKLSKGSKPTGFFLAFFSLGLFHINTPNVNKANHDIREIGIT